MAKKEAHCLQLQVYSVPYRGCTVCLNSLGHGAHSMAFVQDFEVEFSQVDTLSKGVIDFDEFLEVAL
eukprot:4313262-Amphidinium_carterae.2